MRTPYLFSIFLVLSLLLGMWVCETRSRHPARSRRTYLAGVVGGLLEFADAVAPALAIGGGLMRIACFFVGCNFGKPTDLPWAVTYAAGDPAFLKQAGLGLITPAAPATLPVHPTQLYESACWQRHFC